MAREIVKIINADLNKSKKEIKKNDKLFLYREKIDIIDSKISKLLSKRYNLVKNIGEYKKNNDLKITNKNREKKVINNVVKNYKDDKLKKYISKIYSNIIIISKSIEK